MKEGLQTEAASPSAHFAVLPDDVYKPPPLHIEKKEKERDVERAEMSSSTKQAKVVGISRFNAFNDVEDLAREQRSRKMRKKMEGAGWPMTEDRRTWI